MCICTYIHTYTYFYACTHIHTHTCMYILYAIFFTHPSIHVYMHTCICIIHMWFFFSCLCFLELFLTLGNRHLWFETAVEVLHRPWTKKIDFRLYSVKRPISFKRDLLVSKETFDSNRPLLTLHVIALAHIPYKTNHVLYPERSLWTLIGLFWD